MTLQPFILTGPTEDHRVHGVVSPTSEEGRVDVIMLNLLADPIVTHREWPVEEVPTVLAKLQQAFQASPDRFYREYAYREYQSDRRRVYAYLEPLLTHLGYSLAPVDLSRDWVQSLDDGVRNRNVSADLERQVFLLGQDCWWPLGPVSDRPKSHLREHLRPLNGNSFASFSSMGIRSVAEDFDVVVKDGDFMPDIAPYESADRAGTFLLGHPRSPWFALQARSFSMLLSEHEDTGDSHWSETAAISAEIWDVPALANLIGKPLVSSGDKPTHWKIRWVGSPEECRRMRDNYTNGAGWTL